jgi:hypothetical protein
MSWILKWSFDKANYAPGEVALVSFWAENIGSTPIYISSISMNFDFGTYMLENMVGGMIKPRQDEYLWSEFRLLRTQRTAVSRLYVNLKSRRGDCMDALMLYKS